MSLIRNFQLNCCALFKPFENVGHTRSAFENVIESFEWETFENCGQAGFGWKDGNLRCRFPEWTNGVLMSADFNVQMERTG